MRISGWLALLAAGVATSAVAQDATIAQRAGLCSGVYQVLARGAEGEPELEAWLISRQVIFEQVFYAQTDGRLPTDVTLEELRAMRASAEAEVRALYDEAPTVPSLLELRCDLWHAGIADTVAARGGSGAVEASEAAYLAFLLAVPPFPNADLAYSAEARGRAASTQAVFDAWAAAGN